jgi:hypothetical protein
MNSPAHSAASRPRTTAGLWLVATLLGRSESRKLLSGRLNGGRPGWNDDEPAVVESTCELLMGRYFGADYEVRDVTAFVSMLREASGENLGGGMIRAEALIRSALGEAEVDIQDIGSLTRLQVHIVASGIAAERLGLDERDVGQLVAEAEDLTFAKGRKPPLAAL